MAKDRVEIDILANTKKAGDGIKGLMGNLAKIGAVVGGLKGLQSVLNTSIENYNKQIAAESKLSSVLKSTGNQLGKSQKELQEYASSLQDMTGVGDEVIINAQAQMATFTKIGGDVFPRAIEAALDMSKAFDQDLKGSTIQLGKALQDPIQGVTALRRVGVQLSDQQTEMIKKFMDVGDIASAQEIILGELETQVGGVAKAYGQTLPGQMDIMKASLGDLSEGIGEAAMTAFAPIVNAANDFFKKNKKQIMNILKNLPEIFTTTMELVKNIMKKALSWEGFKKTVSAIGIGFFEVFSAVTKLIPKLFMNALNFLLAPIKNFGAWVGSIFEKIFADVGNFFIDALNVLPFVDIKKMAVKQVEDVGSVAERTFNEMGAIANEYRNDLTDTFDKIGKAAKKTGDTLKEVYGEELKEHADKMDAIINKEEETADAIIETTKETVKTTEELKKEANDKWLEQVEKIKEAYKEIQGVITTVFSAITGISDQYFANQNASLEEWRAQQEEAINQSITNETERTNALESLDEEYQKKKAALKRKEAIAEKAFAITKSLIDTASAVVEALPNIPLSVTVGALGLINTGLIAAQPIPSFAQGGNFLTSGPQAIMVGDNASGVEEVTVNPVPRGGEPRKQILMIGEKEFTAYLMDAIDRGDIRLARAT